MRPTPDEVHRRVVAQGRALVQMIDAAEVLLENSARLETWLLRFVRALYRRRLRELVALLPPNVTAGILAASQKIHGTVGDISQN